MGKGVRDGDVKEDGWTRAVAIWLCKEMLFEMEGLQE